MQSGEIVSLSKQHVIGGPSDFMEEMTLIKDIGIEGNVFQGGEKQVCVFFAEARQWMDEQTTRGLCFERFSENILLKGLPLGILKPGDVLSFGDAKLQISGGKPCFDECERYSNHLPCRLSKNAFFAVVLSDGSIKLGDKVFLT